MKFIFKQWLISLNVGNIYSKTILCRYVLIVLIISYIWRINYILFILISNKLNISLFINILVYFLEYTFIIYIRILHYTAIILFGPKPKKMTSVSNVALQECNT